MISQTNIESDRVQTLELMRQLCRDVIAFRLSGQLGDEDLLTTLRHKAVKALTSAERDAASASQLNQT